jgi:phosphoglycerate dehydrogenase-like enzyme
MIEMFRVAVLDDYQHVAHCLADWNSLAPRAQVEFFHDNLVDLPRLASRLQSFQAVVLMRERTPFPRALVEQLPNLRLLVTAGMRNASIDVDAAGERGVLVTGTETLATPTAEFTWGLILALSRNLVHEANGMRSGQWQTTVGHGVAGKTLGVLGLGKLGSRVAAVGKAFGMRVLAWSQNLTPEKASEAGAVYASREDLLESSDIVTIHLVLSERTRNLIGASELARMKPSAFLVNTSRGPIVNQAALLEALSTRRIAGAAIDVYDQEPLPADHPLRKPENLLLTPHLGYVTEENYRTIYGCAVENIRAFLDGKPMRAINKMG